MPSNRIAEIRKAKGLSQKQLADLSGITNYTIIQRYEYGQRTPTVFTAMRLARALGVTVEELFVLDGE